MIEKQSDNFENPEENVSEDVNENEDSPIIENQTSEDKQSPEADDENIYAEELKNTCLLYTSPSPRDNLPSRMPSSA